MLLFTLVRQRPAFAERCDPDLPECENVRVRTGNINPTPAAAAKDMRKPLSYRQAGLSIRRSMAASARALGIL